MANESKKSDGEAHCSAVDDSSDIPPALAAELARAEALLTGGPRAPAEAPAWLDALVGGRVAVALFPGTEADPGWLAAEVVAPGVVAAAVDAADADAVQRLIEAARAATRGGGRGAVAEGPGLLGQGALLGEVQESAAALYQWLAESGRPGLIVDDATLQRVRQPALPAGPGYLLRAAAPAARSRGRFWPALALAAAALVGFGLFQATRTAPPAGHIFVVGEHTSMERGAADQAVWRAGDQVVITIEGEPGSYLGLVLLDSAGQLVVPDAAAVNVMATATAPRLSIRQEFDQTPGRERFVGLVSRGPLPDLPALLTRVNAEAAADRAARLDALARALGAEVTLVPATEMEHR
ncbi:MAG: hypothetical protein H6706_22640 [Myxococcales bacterium]|nr:hypothetical protein [Myxococcales bacterium]